MFVLWLIAVIAFVYLEVHTQTFYSMFVAAGSAGAAITDLLGGSLWLQGIVFAGVSLGGVLTLRPVLLDRFERQRPPLKLQGIHASVDGLIGQRALTVDVVGDEHHPGHALLAGERWLAVTDTPVPLPPQVPVVVLAVRGTTLLVHPAL